MNRITEIWIDGRHEDPTSLKLRRVNPDQWAVTRRGECLNKNGEWEYEPMPSSRDQAFFDRCRFASAQEAHRAYRKLKTEAKEPVTRSSAPSGEPFDMMAELKKRLKALP